MRIIVNHLTRMQPGYICVAGIDVASGHHIRPVLKGRISTHLLASNGGPFGMAALVDLGAVQYCGRAPQVEDHTFHFINTHSLGVIPHERFWKMLQNVARSSLVEIFGSALRAHRNGCVVDLGEGEASLGCLIPSSPPHLYVGVDDKIRANITDGTFTVNLSVTDIRLCETDHKTPKTNLIKQINTKMQNGTPTIVSVGLGRPWRYADDSVERHWLQVNNVHLGDDAVW